MKKLIIILLYFALTSTYLFSLTISTNTDGLPQGSTCNLPSDCKAGLTCSGIPGYRTCQTPMPGMSIG